MCYAFRRTQRKDYLWVRMKNCQQLACCAFHHVVKYHLPIINIKPPTIKRNWGHDIEKWSVDALFSVGNLR